MTQPNPIPPRDIPRDPPRDPSARRALIGVLVGAGVFLVLMIGVGVWLIRTYVLQPSETVILTDIPAAVTGPRPGTPAPAPMPVLGGVVNDEQGAPVADARVDLTWQQLGDRKATVQTDAKGHWTYASIPRGRAGNVKFSVSKPDYITTALGTQPAADLLKQAVVFVMPHAGGVVGDVFDAAGRPLSGAQITSRTQANNPPGEAPPHGQSDADGHFGVGPLAAGKPATITVTMPGFAPALQTVQAANPAPAVHFVLTTGRTLKGRVTDAGGQPIAGAAVTLNQWRGVHSFDINATTDRDGLFTVNDAPMDQLGLRASKNSYNFNIVSYPPAKLDGQFRLSLTPTISGAVTDANTHKPITQFNVIVGFRRQPDQPPNFVASSSRAFKDGKYNVIMHGTGGVIESWFLRVQAQGYLPWDSPPIAPTDNPSTLDFALPPAASDLKGTVLNPGGQAAQGVQLAEVLSHGSLNYPAGLMIKNSSSATDAQGHFDLPVQSGDFILAAFGASGYTQLNQDELSGNVVIQLQPWAKLTGTLTKNGRPVPDQEIRAHLAPPPSANTPPPFVSFSARTDEDGNFHIDRVPPGTLMVGPVTLQNGANGALIARFTQTQHVTVAPGQTAQVNLAQ